MRTFGLAGVWRDTSTENVVCPGLPLITPIYITRTERQGGRIVNAVIDKIPDVSQEATWEWWNKS